jgi:very-short-patch-repair endonuclease
MKGVNRIFSAHGYRVIRFRNDDVMESREGMWDALVKAMGEA